MRRTRWVAGGLFALAGAAAAALHVGLETAGELREWRQTLPLAALLGGALGAALRPKGWRAGLAAAAAGMAGFAVLFAIGHGLIEALRGAEAPGALAWEAAARAARRLAGPAGLAALVGGAAAGLLTQRLARR